MAEVNASIPLQNRPFQFKSPVEHYSNALALQNAQQANELNALKMSQAQWADANDREADAAMREFYSGSRDPESLNALARRSPRAFTIEQKRRLEEEKDRADIRSKDSTSKKNTVEANIKLYERNAQMLRSAQDQPTWTMVRDQIIREIGPDQGRGVPEQFDPKYRDMLLQATLSEKERLESEARTRAAVVTEANNPVTVSADGKTARPNEVAIGAKSRIAQAGAAQVPIQVVPTADGLSAVTTRITRGQPTVDVIPINEPGGGRAKPAPPAKASTAEEKTSAGFLSRMRAAEALVQENPEGTPTLVTDAVGGIPFVGEYARRKVMSPEQQRFKQAADDWIRAKLRKESGAVIGENEMQQEYITYFPQPGDDPSVLLQKAQARKQAERQMEIGAGVAGSQATVVPRAPAAATQPAKPTTQEEYDALPSGATYIAPDGTMRRKR